MERVQERIVMTGDEHELRNQIKGHILMAKNEIVMPDMSANNRPFLGGLTVLINHDLV